MQNRLQDRYWRKNRRPNEGYDCIGVDLNRNFDVAWGSMWTQLRSTRGVYPRSPAPAPFIPSTLFSFVLFPALSYRSPPCREASPKPSYGDPGERCVISPGGESIFGTRNSVWWKRCWFFFQNIHHRDVC